MQATISTNISDQKQRQRALDTAASFIVQAPAGSGKTSLLVQRYLALLAQVNYPEEILAITFTRKAAAEMRQRIITALNEAASATAASPNENGHAEITRKLARCVLRQNTKRDWQLLESPHRLLLQTIDSFCHQLVTQAPLASRLGVIPNIANEITATRLYRAATHELLASFEDATHATSEQRTHLKNVLIHFDNNVEHFTNLCIAMLARREQWLPYIAQMRGHDDTQFLRAILEQGLATLVAEVITQCQQNFPQSRMQEVIELAEFARANLLRDKNSNKYKLFLSDVDLQLLWQASDDYSRNSLHDTLYAWRQLAALLLTQNDTWRKQVDKNLGFPAASSVRCTDENVDKNSNKNTKETKELYKTMKQQYLALVADLSKIDALAHALQEIKNLPTSHYTDTQWQVLTALIELLPLLAAQLDITMHAAGVVDYTAVALAAERTLGAIDAPTDLALHLDYRIKHILVDEFQDISLAQYRLLQHLTAGWDSGESSESDNDSSNSENGEDSEDGGDSCESDDDEDAEDGRNKRNTRSGDGRTLFLVGDPMQSIYRFRQAEVGLFLRIAQEGIGNIRLNKLQLTTNFRSTPSIIAWLNNSFAKILPAFEDIALGCIPFCAAHAAIDYDVSDQQNITQNAAIIDKVTDGVAVHILTHDTANIPNISNTASVSDISNTSDISDTSVTSTSGDTSDHTNNQTIPSNDVTTMLAALYEAEHVASLIQNIIAQQQQQEANNVAHTKNKHSIAILVSARSHLSHVIPALKNANISYNAVELEPLTSSMIVQDLFTLLRALTNLADRIAWLALLRAPWCGLCLHDLHVIANASDATVSNVTNAAHAMSQPNANMQRRSKNTNKRTTKTIWDNLNFVIAANFSTDAPNFSSSLSRDGMQRVARIFPVIRDSIYQRGRQSLRTWLENTWLALGGTACIQRAYEIEHAAQFFALLDEINSAQNTQNIGINNIDNDNVIDDVNNNNSNYAVDLENLTQRLSKLYLNSTNPQAQVTVMTIHKAKGLEFDHVIVCGLHNQPRVDEHQLLMWLERPRMHSDKRVGGSDLLLAPLKAVGGKESALYRYLRSIEQQKNYYEQGRLLYVAATRAKKMLHLVACVENKKNASNTDKNVSGKKSKNDEKDSELTQSIQHLTKIAKNSLLYQLMACAVPDWFKNIEGNALVEHAEGNTQCTPENVYEKNNQQDHATTFATKTAIITHRLTAGYQSHYQYHHNINALLSNNIVTTGHQQHYILQDNNAALLGTVIHKCLYQLAENFYSTHQTTPHNYCCKQQNYWRKLLMQAGLHDNIENYLGKINDAVTNMLTSDKGLWILNTAHHDVHNEYAMATVVDAVTTTTANCATTINVVKYLTIDRTFIDVDTKVRWIIDYKTTTPLLSKSLSQKIIAHECAKQCANKPGNFDNFDAFLHAEQEKHKVQLEQYAAAFYKKLEETTEQKEEEKEQKNRGKQNNQQGEKKSITIMLGIYFPLCDGWYAWKFK